MSNLNKTGYNTFLIVFLLATFSIGNGIERHQSLLLLITYISAFFAYAFLLIREASSKHLFTVGLLARILLFFSLPSLSDDIYRFIWDGTLLQNGVLPYQSLPATFLNQEITGITTELYAKLNSPNYFTIYPPLNQFIFWLSVTIGQGDWLASANVIRILLYAADLGSFYLLKKLLLHYGKSERLAYWYWLNPLVILEFTGNLHFEGLVIFFLLAGIYFYENRSILFSAGSLGLAVGTKLLPLIYLPFLFFKGVKEKKWVISILAGLIAILTLAPLMNQSFISAMTESLDLYIRSFEFNASFYFIARAIGQWVYGYNNIALVGPLLSVLSLISILTISIFGTLQKWSIPKTLLFILTIYLLFATTVHPWYIIPLIAFGLLSGFKFPIVWSFLIFLTYLGYTKEGFELPMHIIVIEYVVTGLVLLTEIRPKK